MLPFLSTWKDAVILVHPATRALEDAMTTDSLRRLEAVRIRIWKGEKWASNYMSNSDNQEEIVEAEQT